MNVYTDFAFLDSGTGGLPYMAALKEKIPHATFAYLGDTRNFPYGEKSVEEVTECASKAIELILSKWNPRTLVIACNTISVTSLDSLRKRFPELPIVGTVPAIKLAASFTKNKRIGLLATNATVNNPYCRRLEEDFASDCQVISRGDPELIDFIEHDLFTSTEEEKIKAVMPALTFFKKEKCDTIILGCTHFTHLAEVIQKAAGDEIKVVDSRDGVANQALRLLNSEKALPQMEVSDKGVSHLKSGAFYVTAADKAQEKEYEILCRNMKIAWGGVIL
ncbi:glutamate racemase [Treponema sp.]|uniref:glutamate racemase n=1 Tax=Treponema sp. TaxID=166 RepID=UPI0025EAD9C4|nr:glutamate racemase [Treponema sp.]MCR5219259.1 glutamate racemase [Treponema sp.]